MVHDHSSAAEYRARLALTYGHLADLYEITKRSTKKPRREGIVLPTTQMNDCAHPVRLQLRIGTFDSRAHNKVGADDMKGILREESSPGGNKSLPNSWSADSARAFQVCSAERIVAEQPS